jgi:molybdate transport system substrate-binding protein
VRRVLAAGALAGLLAACGTGGNGEQVLTVLAAASLADVLEDVAADYEADHPGTTVRLATGPSSGLARSVVQGSPADVLATASRAAMEPVVEAGLAADPRVFARNEAQIAVPPDDPAAIAGVADLGRPGITVALCQPDVPCGVLATTVLERAGVVVPASTLETDVRAVLTKVSLGEVDAGIVYATDVRAAGERVRGIALPDELRATTEYVVAAVGEPPGAEARAFADHLLGPQAWRRLADAGFLPP